MRAQIEFSRNEVKVRDIAVRPGHVEMEIIPKSKDPDKPMRQWKSRGIHLGLWDKQLAADIGDIFAKSSGHETAVYEAIDVIFTWLENGVVFEISAAESPHDFDVSVDKPDLSSVSNLADSR